MRIWSVFILAMVVGLMGTAGASVADDAAAATADGTAAAAQSRDSAPQTKGAAMPTIAPYLGNRKGAVSLTFDDGFRKEVADAVAILDPLGVKGTFFLIPLRMEDPAQAAQAITWDQAKDLLKTGHELGTHGATKEKLQEAAPDRLDFLVNQSWRLIKERTGVAPVSYALPGGSEPTPPVVAKIREHHYFIRWPELLPNVKRMPYGNAGPRKWSDDETRKNILACRDSGGWAIAVIHSIVGGYAPFASKDEFRGHCQWLKSQQDTLWVAPMGVVGRYVRARDAAKVNVVESKPGSVRFKLTTDLEPADVFRVPLTIVIPAAGAARAAATRANGSAAVATIKDGRILVDVPADGAETTVTWTSGAK